MIPIILHNDQSNLDYNAKHITHNGNHYLIIKNSNPHSYINESLKMLFAINKYIAGDIAIKYNILSNVADGGIANKSYIKQLWDTPYVTDDMIMPDFNYNPLYNGFIEVYNYYIILKITNYYILNPNSAGNITKNITEDFVKQYNYVIYITDIIKKNGVYNPIINIDYKDITQK